MSETQKWPETDLYPGETIIVDTVTISKKIAEQILDFPFSPEHWRQCMAVALKDECDHRWVNINYGPPRSWCLDCKRMRNGHLADA